MGLLDGLAGAAFAVAALALAARYTPGVVLTEIGAAAGGPVILAGDLNATPDVLEFRRLLRDGYRDAAEQAGAGLTRTHPADIGLPPMFAVDHILLLGAVATSVLTRPVSGSDHRALLADVTLATSSAPSFG